MKKELFMILAGARQEKERGVADLRESSKSEKHVTRISTTVDAAAGI